MTTERKLVPEVDEEGLEAAVEAARQERPPMHGANGPGFAQMRAGIRAYLAAAAPPAPAGGDLPEPVWIALDTPGADFDVTFVQTKDEAAAFADGEFVAKTDLFTESQMLAFRAAALTPAAPVAESVAMVPVAGMYRTKYPVSEWNQTSLSHALTIIEGAHPDREAFIVYAPGSRLRGGNVEGTPLPSWLAKLLPATPSPPVAAGLTGEEGLADDLERAIIKIDNSSASCQYINEARHFIFSALRRLSAQGQFK